MSAAEAPRRDRVALAVGSFMLTGLLALGYLAIRLGDLGLAAGDALVLEARFGSVSGLKVGAPVELAGVRVGRVSAIEYDPKAFEARVELTLDGRVELPEDSIAAIRTAGLIGDRFVKLSPGGSERLLRSGGEIRDTESALSLEELISKYIFEGGKQGKQGRSD